MKRLRIVTTPLTLILMTASAWAHHSLAGEFDSDKPVTVQGVITEVKWENPHIWFHVAVSDASGSVVNWAFEGAPPSVMRQAGVQPSLFKVGDHVTINGYRARASSRTYGHAFDLVLPDGRRVIIGRKL